MGIIKKGWWWAYLDDRGVITVKKYTSDWDIQKVEQLPFCKGIFEVFEAPSKHAAQMMIARWLNEQQNEESKKNDNKKIIIPGGMLR